MRIVRNPVFSLVLLLVYYVCFGECAPQQDKAVLSISQGGTPLGKVEIELYSDSAPATVRNFIELARTGKYVNSPFHRVIKDFMIQGGKPENARDEGQSAFKGAPNFKDENLTTKHEPYCVSMANSGKDTNGSQFFITVVPTDWLNTLHVVFGKVTKGQDIVKRISETKTDQSNKPVDPVVITSVEIIDNQTKATRGTLQQVFDEAFRSKKI